MSARKTPRDRVRDDNAAAFDAFFKAVAAARYGPDMVSPFIDGKAMAPGSAPIDIPSIRRVVREEADKLLWWMDTYGIGLRPHPKGGGKP